MMIRALSVAAIIAVGATAVYAQSAAIGQRKDAMKAIGAAAKEPGAVLKGQSPFDLQKIQASLVVYQEQAAKLKDLWPDDSKTGDTKASPAVWERKEQFLALVTKFGADAKAASAAITDEASFKENWPKVMSNCGGCHKEYRQ